MKLLPLLASTLLLLLPACGDRADAAPPPPPKEGLLDKAKNKAKDLAAGLPDLKAAQATLTKLTTELGGITDGPSAQRAKAELQRLVTSLQQQADAKGGVDEIAADLGAAGDKLLAAAKQQIDQLVKDPQVQQAVGPVLQQLKTLLDG